MNPLSQCCIDTALCCNSVTSCGEELSYASSIEASLSKSECCTEPRTTGTNDDCIVFVVYDRILVASDWEFGFFRAEGLTRDNLCCGSCGGEGADLRSQGS